MPGLIFGIVDNGIMLLGAYWGLSMEAIIPGKLRRGAGAIIGAGVGNAVSDFFGGLGEGDPAFALGTFTGCILALAIVPVVGILKRRIKK